MFGAPRERQGFGMQGVAVEKDLLSESGCPAGFDEFEVAVFVRAVDFVTDDRVAGEGEVNPDLMGTTGQGFAVEQSKFAVAVLEAVSYPEPGMGWVAGGMDGLFEPDFARRNCSLAEKRLVHLEFVGCRPTPRDRQVSFGQVLFFDQGMKVSGGSAVLGHEHQSAGFAVEPGDDRDLTPVGDFEGEQLSELMPQRHGSVRLSRMD